MFAKVHSPETLKSEELDLYLEKGWFRMGQTIFTTNFLNFKNQFYSAVWLRVSLHEFSTDKMWHKLVKQNTGLRIEIQKAFITSEKEALYATYKKSISFEASASLNTLLFGRVSGDIFNTQEVNIYDNDKLIATGFFDLGETSAAGIASFYDPVYKKRSLGKYLIYLKIDYCKKLGLQYFYPGYFVPGYSLFDYKLEIGRTVLQYLELTSNTWKSIGNFSKADSPFQMMYDKLCVLRMLLEEVNNESRILMYEFFDANLVPELNGIELFDFPLFLCCSGLADESINPIVFDVRDQQYHWIKCRSVWASNSAGNLNEIYSSHVLKFEQDLFSTEMPEAMTAAILKEIKSEVKTLKERYI